MLLLLLLTLALFDDGALFFRCSFVVRKRFERSLKRPRLCRESEKRESSWAVGSGRWWQQ